MKPNNSAKNSEKIATVAIIIVAAIIFLAITAITLDYLNLI